MKKNINQSLEDFLEAVEAERRASENLVTHLLWILPLVSLIVGYVSYYLLTHKH